MKQRRTNFKSILTIVFFMFFFSTFAQELPNPEVLAKQYLKDLCTLNEQDFTRKYMLTQWDAEDFMKNMTKAYIESGETPSKIFSDSLALRSEIHSLVVKSYKAFKEWQHENNIDSSNLKYHSCEFELKKRRKVFYYVLEELSINVSCDTVNYVFSCEDFVYLKTKWIGGDFDNAQKADQYFNTIYEEYDYASEAVVDTAVAYDYAEEAEYYESTEEVYEAQPLTKKQLKIQKKIDAYNRKIDALYIKQYE